MKNHPTDSNCIFCKIIAGDIPCYKVYEDDEVLSFLDIGPLATGHTLVIPKGHYVTLDEMPAALAGKCMQMVVTIGKAVMAACPAATGWNVLQNNGAVAGQAVGHVHFHIIPRQDGDGLGYRWPAGELGSDDAVKLLEAVKEGLS